MLSFSDKTTLYAFVLFILLLPWSTICFQGIRMNNRIVRHVLFATGGWGKFRARRIAKLYVSFLHNDTIDKVLVRPRR
jgi:hypothetical protein